MAQSISEDLLSILEHRFHKNMQRHASILWSAVISRLDMNSSKIAVLSRMEETGGEPDVVGVDVESGRIIFMDCAAESPLGRRSLCYDRKAWDERKEHKPLGNATDIAEQIGIEILDTTDYQFLQSIGDFDLKTSSWLSTPDSIRALGGALFGDKRYKTTFVYHNGAQSYYAARGFRGKLFL